MSTQIKSTCPNPAGAFYCLFETPGYAGGATQVYRWEIKTPCVKLKLPAATGNLIHKEVIVMVNDINNLSHTTWNCKYHIVFAPKYRRQIFYKEKKSEIGKILRQLCEWKKIEILEAEVCPDHIHMLVRIPPSISVSGFMGYLKGKSSLMIFEKWGNLKYRYGNRNFWCRGYYVDTVGKNTKKIKEYIENQLKTDRIENPLPFYDGLDGVLGKSKRKSC